MFLMNRRALRVALLLVASAAALGVARLEALSSPASPAAPTALPLPRTIDAGVEDSGVRERGKERAARDGGEFLPLPDAGLLDQDGGPSLLDASIDDAGPQPVRRGGGDSVR